MITISVHDIFVVLNYISVFVMFMCSFIIGTHKGSPMQRFALLVSIALTMCCIGFLFRSEARDAYEFVLGQKLVYAFVSHGMFNMLLFILEYCKFTVPKFLKWVFHGLNFLVTLTVLTLDHHDLFYKDYWAVQRDGYIMLEKEYGFMHTVAVGLFAFYMAAAVVITVIFTVKNIRKRSKYVWRVLIAVMIPCLSYIVPKVTDINNDTQPIAFAAFTVMVIYMIYNNNLYDIQNIAARFSIASVDEAIIVLDRDNLYRGCNACAERMFPILKTLNLDCFICAEAPIMKDFLFGNITEYESGEETYSVSVCPINEGFVQGKVIKFDNITIQKQYTDLLQAQKNTLESEVETLSNYSYTDDLTAIGNRRSFEEMINEIRSYGSLDNIAIGLADLNGLKQINDTICHAAGDELIKGAAGVLNSVFSRYGKVFRIGGDEYCIILITLPYDFSILTDKLQDKASKWKGHYSSGISISYGFVFGRDYENTTVDRLLIEADKLMYENKRRHYENKSEETE